MKNKAFTLIVFFTLILSGCTIDYTNFRNEIKNTDEEEHETPNSNNNEITIEDDALFFPSTLNLASNEITNYTYVDSNLTSSYQIYSAYYSEKYDTIYISYDSISSPSQTLKAKDLHEIENHILNYFESDINKIDYKEYLKAIRIYPDRLASSCRKGLDDDRANTINGCADYGGKEAIIDLNNTTSLDDFYNPKITPTQFGQTYEEPMRDTLAHEYGHVSTFYHMVYKSDENYEDYLKIRLGDLYDTIYPSGLPDNYSSGSSYTIQPEEILADDYVELFYNTSNKSQTDIYDYTLSYNDLRNSLYGYDSVKKLKNNTELYNTIKQYYENNFLNYSNRIEYDNPIVVSSSTKIISYYDSYSKIGNQDNLKTIISINDVNLLAIGEVTISSTKYYRIILSNTFNCPRNTCDKKDIGEKIGYVEANLFITNNTIKIYKINRFNNETLSKNNLLYIEDDPTESIFFLPFYDFSFVLNTTDDSNYATMYDYLNTQLTNQKYKINIYSLGTLIN